MVDASFRGARGSHTFHGVRNGRVGCIGQWSTRRTRRQRPVPAAACPRNRPVPGAACPRSGLSPQRKPVLIWSGLSPQNSRGGLSPLRPVPARALTNFSGRFPLGLDGRCPWQDLIVGPGSGFEGVFLRRGVAIRVSRNRDLLSSPGGPVGWSDWLVT